MKYEIMKDCEEYELEAGGTIEIIECTKEYQLFLEQLETSGIIRLIQENEVKP
jgi:hypothetical protein